MFIRVTKSLRVPSLKGACKANSDLLEEAMSLTTNIWAENLTLSGRKVLEWMQVERAWAFPGAPLSTGSYMGWRIQQSNPDNDWGPEEMPLSQCSQDGAFLLLCYKR